MRTKVTYNKNYISKSLEDFFLFCPLITIERKIIRDCLTAQLQYGKLTNRRWERVVQIYHKYKDYDHDNRVG
jgi:hypothetical protein